MLERGTPTLIRLTALKRRAPGGTYQGTVAQHVRMVMKTCQLTGPERRRYLRTAHRLPQPEARESDLGSDPAPEESQWSPGAFTACFDFCFESSLFF